MNETQRIIIASYFHYWGVEVAEMLGGYEVATQRRITQLFMKVVRDELFRTEDGTTIVTIDLPTDIAEAVNIFIRLYDMDKRMYEVLVMIKSHLEHEVNNATAWRPFDVEW